MMKILLVCNEQCITLTLKAILDMNGYETRAVDAQLCSEVVDGLYHAAYSPEVEKRILDQAQAFQPHWILMILQAHSRRQIDTLMKIRELTRTRFFLLGGGLLHESELERARKLGLTFQFRCMPCNTEEMLMLLSTPFGKCRGCERFFDSANGKIPNFCPDCGSPVLPPRRF